jgi:hypothetical protein
MRPGPGTTGRGAELRRAGGEDEDQRAGRALRRSKSVTAAPLDGPRPLSSLCGPNAVLTQEVQSREPRQAGHPRIGGQGEYEPLPAAGAHTALPRKQVIGPVSGRTRPILGSPTKTVNRSLAQPKSTTYI